MRIPLRRILDQLMDREEDMNKKEDTTGLSRRTCIRNVFIFSFIHSFFFFFFFLSFSFPFSFFA